MDHMNNKDLSKLTKKELADIIGNIQTEAYERCKPYMSELGKRFQEDKQQEQENLKKAS